MRAKRRREEISPALSKTTPENGAGAENMLGIVPHRIARTWDSYALRCCPHQKQDSQRGLSDHEYRANFGPR